MKWGAESQKKRAEDRKIENQGKRDVSWYSMMDGCIRRLKVDPRSTVFGGKAWDCDPKIYDAL